MSLKQAVEDPSLFTQRLKIKALAPVNLQKAIKLIRSDGESTRTALDVEALQRQFAEHVAAGALSSVATGALKQTPYGFFDGPKPFADDEITCAALLEEIARRSHRPSVRLLIYQYLEYFNPQRPGFRRLADWLQIQVPRWDWSWRTRMERMALFDPDAAPERLATDFMGSEEGVEERAREAGLSVISLAGGLGAAAFGAACGQVAASRAAIMPSAQSRLIDWHRVQKGYDAQQTTFVNALLRPWRDAEPDVQHKTVLMTALEEIGGDPRVHPARWLRVKAEAPEAYALLLKWLTKASVYQFFDIIDDMIPYDQSHMWAYRRPFWTAYLEAGHIDEAWVVFGANGVARARDTALQSGGKTTANFGKLVRAARGKTADHAALILKIGDLVIAEWSHSGAYQIWPVSSKLTPKLYALSYDPDDLMDGPEMGTHGGSENYTWQYRVHEYIRRKTARTTSSNDWRPRR